MVFPSIRSVEEIDCLSLFDESPARQLSSEQILPQNRKVTKIISPRIIGKNFRRMRSKKNNYPIAS